MMTTTTKAIEQQSLNLDSISNLIESNFEALLKVFNDIEPELEDILVKEFDQGLPTDIIAGF
jgi:hypothetical protein